MNVLYVDKLCPYPPIDGRSVRVFNLLKQLSRHHQVTLICNSPEEAPPIPMPITVKCVPFPNAGKQRRLSFFNLFTCQPHHQQFFQTRNLSEAVRKHINGNAVDIAFVDSVYLAGLIPVLRGRPVIVSEHNFEPQMMLDRSRAQRNPLLKILFLLQYVRTLRLQRWAVRQPAASFICVSRHDSEQIKSLNENANVYIVPNGVDTKLFAYSKPEKFETVCFLGSLAWAPNVDGLRYFIGMIWPEIKRAKPKAMLKVVGQDPEGVAKQFVTKDIDFTGKVDDVTPHVKATSIFIVPLRYGGGTKLKMLEAMALGRPVVTTAKGAEGIEGIENGINAIIVKGPINFANSVVQLINDTKQAVNIGLRGRQLVEKKYNWNIIGHDLNIIIVLVAGIKEHLK